jgi:hypothetical protein
MVGKRTQYQGRMAKVTVVFGRLVSVVGEEAECEVEYVYSLMARSAVTSFEKPIERLWFMLAVSWLEKRGNRPRGEIWPLRKYKEFERLKDGGD